MKTSTSRIGQWISIVLVCVGILGLGFLGYRIVNTLMSTSTDVADSGIDQPQVRPIAEDAPVVADPTYDEISIGIRIGERAPDFQLLTLDGDLAALSDYRGHVIILDFWASWCTPCRLTMPSVETLVKALEPDVVLLGVSLDRSAQNAVDYLTRNGFDAMIGLYGSYAAAYGVFQTYGNGGIPKTFVIDREGIIRYVGHPSRLSKLTLEPWL